MKKVVLRESDLIRIVQKIVLEREEEVKKAYILVAKPIKEPGKPRLGKMVWGKYKDGSTIFIPYGQYKEYDSKPNLYFSIEDASKEAESLMKFYRNLVITIEPLKK